MQLMHNAMRELQVWNQLLVICLNTPPRPTWGHSMHFYNQALRSPPLYTYHPTRVPIKRAQAEEPKKLVFAGSGPVKFWSIPPKLLAPPPRTLSDLTQLYISQ